MLIFEKTKKSLNKLLLNEGAETRNMSAAKHYLYNTLKCDEKAAMNYIGKIKTDIPNSRLGKCKFMLAMARMFCNGQLNDGTTILELNKALKYATSDTYINQFNQDLNGLNPQQFIQQFKEVAKQDLQQDMDDLSSQQYDEQNSQYEIVRINSFEEAEEYSDFVEWCITNDERMFNSYTNNGQGLFYFCLRNDYEDVEEVKGQNCPLDDYGLSMIAVSVNPDGSCNTITCRWNHSNGGSDNVMTPKQLSQIINRNFYTTFKPLTKEEQEANRQRIFTEINYEIDEQFNYYDNLGDFCTNLYCDEDQGNTDERNFFVYDSEQGSVILDNEGNMVVNELFVSVHPRIGDIFVVQKNDKFNFMNMDGNYISQTWYDKVSNLFDYDMGMVYLKNKNKWSLINRNGEIILPWCDAISDSIYSSMSGSNIIEVLNNNQWDYVDLNNGGYSIFNQDIVDIRTMPSYCKDEFKTWRLIKFEDENYYYLYDMYEGHLVCPYEIKTVIGRVEDMPLIVLKNENTVAIDEDGTLYSYNQNAPKGQKFTIYNPNQQVNENKQKKIIFITEQQAKKLKENINQQFSIDYLKSKQWKNGTELVHYCDTCNLLFLGKGGNRIVYQINDELVLKIENDNKLNNINQNAKEVQSFNQCDNEMKQFVPNIFDYDKNNQEPLWIVAEQVLPASYADFQKLLGIDFGSYTSQDDINQMKQELKDYSKYDGKKADAFSINLMDFLDAYGEGDLSLYQSDIYNNKWLQELIKILDKGIAFYWELEIIENWGLVKRNGQPKLIILDIGI